MVAMDDFLTFKKLMVKRNMELELETVKVLQSAALPLSEATTAEEAEAEFEAALKMSECMSPAEKLGMIKKEQEESKERDKSRRALPSAEETAEMELQLKAAIEANMAEMDIFHKQEVRKAKKGNCARDTYIFIFFPFVVHFFALAYIFQILLPLTFRTFFFCVAAFTGIRAASA